ncbi:hypothetical protein C8Q77DRAFT_1113501 [Trametes polyzona]|nr:hypothetical protein C8Q77DRAFT_1113501 [Trametes polyzona]
MHRAWCAALTFIYLLPFTAESPRRLINPAIERASRHEVVAPLGVLLQTATQHDPSEPRAEVRRPALAQFLGTSTRAC